MLNLMKILRRRFSKRYTVEEIIERSLAIAEPYKIRLLYLIPYSDFDIKADKDLKDKYRLVYKRLEGSTYTGVTEFCEVIFETFDHCVFPWGVSPGNDMILMEAEGCGYVINAEDTDSYGSERIS